MNGRRIVQIPGADNAKLGTRRRRCKQMRTATRAELLNDLVSTICNSLVRGQRSGNNKTIGIDKQIDRSVCRQVLAVAAPADSGRKRFRYDFETDRATQTSTGSIGHLYDPL
jgi:hypothetical protein